MNIKQIFYKYPGPILHIFNLMNDEYLLDYEDDEGHTANIIFLAAFNKIFNSIIACELWGDILTQILTVKYEV